jgi:hypothetical protein
MLARKARGWHTRVGETYHALVSAFASPPPPFSGVSPDRHRLLRLRAVGYVAAKLRFSGWLRIHIVGQGGSYIAMTTALLVVNLGRASFRAICTISRFSGAPCAAARGPGARGAL